MPGTSEKRRELALRNDRMPPGRSIASSLTSPRSAPTKVFVRERRGAPAGPVVLFVQGRAAAAVPAFDLEYGDYSWMTHLADAGFDVFAMDLQGYGRSSKPTVMEDPCNTSVDNQAR
jgi:alpha-beta hydrolase superfamily lysophospholipase